MFLCVRLAAAKRTPAPRAIRVVIHSFAYRTQVIPQ
jgi:hypothetical protein